MSYITPTDIYDEGIDPADYPAPDVQIQIDLWQEFIEAATKQWFEDRLVEFYIDGTGMESLWFQVPVISLDELYINGDFTNAVDLDAIAVYNRTPSDALKDDRKNPRISIKRSRDVDGTIYDQAFLNRVFEKGHLNQKVKGHFGYLENGATPARIIYALKKLVINHLGKLGDPGSGPGVDPLAALKRREVTDGHSIEYASLWGSSGAKKTDWIDVVQDPVINGILKMFMAPRIVAVVYSEPGDFMESP